MATWTARGGFCKIFASWLGSQHSMKDHNNRRRDARPLVVAMMDQPQVLGFFWRGSRRVKAESDASDA